MSYQWFLNGVLLGGENQKELTLDNVNTDLNGSSVICQVSNEFGSATSQVARISVTLNTRPVPQIEFPLENSTYSAGDVLNFSGFAQDQEEGQLLVDQLSWRIDFHHDDHTHPGLSETSGVREGTYQIPTLGEVSDNVWYRVYLTATDQEGLKQTVFRDVFPEKVEFQITSEPEGVRINVDGRQEVTPVTITGVRGTVRTLKAPGSFDLSNGLYLFDEWENEGEEQIIQFFANDSEYKVKYDFLPYGNGTGLRGHYFESQNRSFGGIAKLERLDRVIDFNWVHGSPHPSISADYFTTRWRGKVIPLLDGRHSFHITSDDGVRLWIDDQLIIDDWQPHAALENSGSIDLIAGKPVPIRLEYFEDAGEAVVQLKWSHEQIKKQIIPTTQLVPEREIASNVDVDVNLIPSVTTGPFSIEILSKRLGRARVYLMDMAGRILWFDESVSVLPNVTEIPVDNPSFTPGIYVVHVSIGDISITKRLVISNP